MENNYYRKETHHIESFQLLTPEEQEIILAELAKFQYKLTDYTLKVSIEKNQEARRINQEKRQKLEAGGWTVGTVEEFLELTPEETEIVNCLDE